MRNHLDEAFTRRLRFSIEFPFPDEDSRRRLWQRAFPPEVPRDADIEIDFLAQRFKLSGGNIANTALTSAFLAAREGSSVSMRHVARAIKREYQKMGRLLNRTEFGRFFNLVSDEACV
jgi:AAA+ superfamily predicted ATPase